MEVLFLKIKPEEVSKIIRSEIENYKNKIDISNTGTVLEVGDGIARIYGLSDAMSGELLEFENGATGMALNCRNKRRKPCKRDRKSCTSTSWRRITWKSCRCAWKSN